MKNGRHKNVRPLKELYDQYIKFYANNVNYVFFRKFINTSFVKLNLKYNGFSVKGIPKNFI